MDRDLGPALAIALSLHLLIVGAVTFRVARAGKPYSKGSILVGTTVIVLAGWGYSVYVEANSLPYVLGEIALKSTRDIGEQGAAAFEASVADRVREYMDTAFAPGGAVGYVRWVVKSGRIPRDVAPEVRSELSVSQRGYVWIIRAALSLGLLAFGVASQTLTLTPVSKQRDKTIA